MSPLEAGTLMESRTGEARLALKPGISEYCSANERGFREVSWPGEREVRELAITVDLASCQVDLRGGAPPFGGREQPDESRKLITFDPKAAGDDGSISACQLACLGIRSVGELDEFHGLAPWNPS
jgi:hypothetical protein